MALFEDIEPPLSHSDSEDDKKIDKQGKTTASKQELFFKNIKNLINKNKIKNRLDPFLVKIKKIKFNQYLPHVAVVSLGLIVSITNIGHKMLALAYSPDIVTTDPSTQYSVAESVGNYTPLIQNAGALVEQSNAATASSDGFANNITTVSTAITERSDPALDNSAQTVTYTVQNGDTLSGLGMKFNVKIATLEYLNNIDNENLIKPGVQIKVPPKGYEVADSTITAWKNKKAAQLAASTKSSTSKSKKSAVKVKINPGSSQNGYPYGYCTYFVATRRFVPSSWGNAKNWLSSAKRAGYSTGQTPVAGAIMVTNESWWGHVAYVESVNGDTITISEMNYEGWGVIDHRTISIGSGNIRGFVY